MKKNRLIAGIGMGIILTLGVISVAQTNRSQSNKTNLCQGQFPNGEYTGKFDISTNNELSYYTEFLTIENDKITIFPTFNGQSLGMDFNIKADNVKIECK